MTLSSETVTSFARHSRRGIHVKTIRGHKTVGNSPSSKYKLERESTEINLA